MRERKRCSKWIHLYWHLSCPHSFAAYQHPAEHGIAKMPIELRRWIAEEWWYQGLQRLESVLHEPGEQRSLDN